MLTAFADLARVESGAFSVIGGVNLPEKEGCRSWQRGRSQSERGMRQWRMGLIKPTEVSDTAG